MSRSYEQISALPAGITPLTGAELCELEQDGVSRKFPMSDMAGITAAHEAHHQRDGSDPIGSDEVEAYAIPYLDASGRIDTRVSDASTSRAGKVMLAADEEEDGAKATASNDSRLSDARAPTEHASQHIAGTDVIADATVSNSGLMSATDKTKLDGFDYGVTADEKAALAGSYGMPDAANKYVTETDPRIESATGLPVGVPIPVYGQVLATPFEPCNGQMIDDAESDFDGTRLPNLNGASVFLDLTFTADAGGSYAEIDEADSPALGLHDWIIGSGIAAHSWISDIGLPEFVATTQTARDYWCFDYDGSDIFCLALNDNIYKKDGSGIFQTTSQTVRDWVGLQTFNGEQYASVQGVSGNIYKKDGSGVFQTTSQTPGMYKDFFIHNDELCCIVGSSGIHKMDEFGAFSLYLAGDIYAAVSYQGVIVYQTFSSNNLLCYDGASSYIFASQTAAQKASRLRVIDGNLYKIEDYVLSVYSGGGVFTTLNDVLDTTTRDIALVNDTLYLASITPSGDVYTLDYSKRLLTISDPAATGAISCTITNEGRGIIGGGAFGSVGDQMQQITGGAASASDRPGLVSFAKQLYPESQGALSFYNAGTADGTSGEQQAYAVGFDSADSPYARTSADTWGKTKTDAYKLTYYMRIK